jgi:hypothetical protein
VKRAETRSGTTSNQVRSQGFNIGGERDDNPKSNTSTYHPLPLKYEVPNVLFIFSTMVAY